MGTDVAKRVEKWVLCRAVHLGFARDSYSPSTIIEHHIDDGFLIIEGKRIESDRDLIALKKLVEKTGFEWVKPYSTKSLSEAKKVTSSLAKDKPAFDDDGHKEMKIIRSDQDEIRAIDISSTKNRPHERSKKDKLDVIKGDEAAQERLVRLQNEIPRMPIIQDESLGQVVGPTLTNGVVKSPPAEKRVAIDTEGLPRDVEVTPLPLKTEMKESTIVTEPKTEVMTEVKPIKRGRGRPRKSKKIG